MNFRLSDVVFNSWITVWCLLNWKRKLCRYVCTMYVCYKCVCVWGYVYTMVCVGVWGHPHLLHCLRQGLSCCLPLHYVLQASWPGVSCFSFLSCHMSDKKSHHVQLHGFVVIWATRLAVLPVLPTEPPFSEEHFLVGIPLLFTGYRHLYVVRVAWNSFVIPTFGSS